MTPEEIQKLLDVVPEHRRLLYEVAFTKGLRAGELRALTVKHLDVVCGGLRLDAAWTKNRKDGFQQIPSWLSNRLADRSNMKSKDPLLAVPSHPSRELDKDLKAADIPKVTDEGKIDFHALRVAYVSFVLEAGASAKEAQTLARHSTAELTMNVYARARNERLREVAEAVGSNVSTGEIYDHSMAQGENAPCGGDAKVIDISMLSGSEREWRRRESNPRLYVA